MIYTSDYFTVSTKELYKPLYIQISNSCPPNFNVDGIWTEVIPSWYGMVNPYKKGKITEDEYLNRYRAQVKEASEQKLFQEIVNDLKFYDENSKKDVVLLCWCHKGKFCHRNWLRSYLNINYQLHIKEL